MVSFIVRTFSTSALLMIRVMAFSFFSRSTLMKHGGTRIGTLPAAARELRRRGVLGRSAEAEIGDQTPALRRIERAADDLGLEDRNPAETDALGAGCQPQRVNRHHRRVRQRLR